MFGVQIDWQPAYAAMHAAAAQKMVLRLIIAMDRVLDKKKQ
jgi:hypothetical protein